MNKSEQINDLAAALARTQAALNRAKESATNPFLRNSYADLGDVWDAARIPMTENGLSVSQFPTGDGDSIGLVTVLMHESGQWLEDTIYLPLSDEKGKSQAQVAGSIISYLRRYGLSAVLGIVTGEDDDGNAGSDPRQQRDSRGATSPQAQAQRPRPKPPNGSDPSGARQAAEVKAALIAASQDGSSEPASEGQLKYARASISKLVESDADRAKLLLYQIYGIDSSADLTGGQASALIDWIGSVKENGYTPTEQAQTEAGRLLRAFQIEQGQGELAID